MFGDQEKRKRWSCRLDTELYNCPMIIADTNIFLAAALDEPEKSDIVRLTAHGSRLTAHGSRRARV